MDLFFIGHENLTKSSPKNQWDNRLTSQHSDGGLQQSELFIQNYFNIIFLHFLLSFSFFVDILCSYLLMHVFVYLCVWIHKSLPQKIINQWMNL